MFISWFGGAGEGGGPKQRLYGTISSVLISIGKSLALPSIMINVPYSKYDCLLKMTRIASSKDSKDSVYFLLKEMLKEILKEC